MANFFRRRTREQTSPGLIDLWFARDEDEAAIWDALQVGPSADELGTRLSSVPQSFLDDRVGLAALAGDVLGLDLTSLAAQVDATGSSAARRGAAIALWLWASEEELGPLSVALRRDGAECAIAALAFRLAGTVDPAEWISDAERRDEAVRTFLLWLEQAPAGEGRETAKAMFEMRDSLQHSKALADALNDHQHRLEVTKRLQEARAKEAAARYSSE
ncbi:MAG: phosphohydrolase [Microbacteriaceae bacterium]|nr:phosphohydrolase [Microbacteriaceae bacterium]